uniref:PHD-type domain-containing protein n=1 Tax=Glossina pallidipes TaxID=7398 RepID=A0A1A9ZGL5_GLOPL
MSACVLCKSSKKDELLYGKFVATSSGISAHTFCLYFASNLAQNGRDHQGLYGFLQRDIRNEVCRIRQLTCCYCKKSSAGIGCCKEKCRSSFHFICGLENGAENQFCESFRSYCHKHRTSVNCKPPASRESCCICYNSLRKKNEVFNSWRHLKAPCCANGWFHKLCLQKFAAASGYFFKCPLCNNTKLFREKLKYQGIFIPDQDAAWEFEPNAYAELLERPSECVVVECKSKVGRQSNSTRNPLIFCNTCGSKAIHKHCLMNGGGKEFQCNDCAPILKALDSSKKISPHQQDSDDNDFEIDVCEITDEKNKLKENNETTEDLQATTSENITSRSTSRNCKANYIFQTSNDEKDCKGNIFTTTNLNGNNKYSQNTSDDENCENAYAATSEEEIFRKSFRKYKKNEFLTIFSDVESEPEESTSITKRSFQKSSHNATDVQKTGINLNVANQRTQAINCEILGDIFTTSTNLNGKNSYFENTSATTLEEEILQNSFQKYKKNKCLRISSDVELEAEESTTTKKRTFQRSSRNPTNEQKHEINVNAPTHSKQAINCDAFLKADNEKNKLATLQVSKLPLSDNDCNHPIISSSIPIKFKRNISSNNFKSSHISINNSSRPVRLRTKSVLISKEEQIEREKGELNKETFFASTMPLSDNHRRTTQRNKRRSTDLDSTGNQNRNSIGRDSCSERCIVSCIANRTRRQSLNIDKFKNEGSKGDEQRDWASPSSLDISCIAKRTRLSLQKSSKTKAITVCNVEYSNNEGSESSDGISEVYEIESEYEMEDESIVSTDSYSIPSPRDMQDLSFIAVRVKNRSGSSISTSNDSNNNNKALTKRFKEDRYSQESSLSSISNILKTKGSNRIHSFKRHLRP